MAHNAKLLIAAAALALLPGRAAAEPAQIVLTVQLVSQQIGNTAHDYLEVTSTDRFVSATHTVPTRRGTSYCLWSTWSLIRLNTVSHARTYGVSIFDGCNNDTQVFPIPKDIRQGSCNNDDALYPSSKYSLCPIIPEGHVPAGLPFDRRCKALTEVDTSLLTALTPQSYDSTKPTTLTLSTSFTSDMT